MTTVSKETFDRLIELDYGLTVHDPNPSRADHAAVQLGRLNAEMLAHSGDIEDLVTAGKALIISSSYQRLVAAGAGPVSGDALFGQLVIGYAGYHLYTGMVTALPGGASA